MLACDPVHVMWRIMLGSSGAYCTGDNGAGCIPILFACNCGVY